MTNRNSSWNGVDSISNRVLSTDEHSTDGHSRESHSTDGHSTDGHSTDEHSTDGHSTDGHSTDEHSRDGHSTDEHSRESHSRESQGTLPLPTSDWSVLAEAVAHSLNRIFGRSLNIRHIDVGSCNACESEVLSLSNPYYNIHRLGIFFTASPRHADVLLVTGAMTKAMQTVLINTYDAMPKPRIVVATGVCAIHGGLFRNSSEFAGPVDSVIPVDAYIPGCPPTPYAIINGILQGIQRRKAVNL